MSAEYVVVWTMSFDAKNPREAAQKALATMLNPESIATVFEVETPDHQTVVVDLLED